MVSFNYDPVEKALTGSFSGRLDTLAVQKISEIVKVSVPKSGDAAGDRIIFDLKEVDYISSSFIRICVDVAKQAAQGQFSIINCQPFIKKTFKLSGLDTLLNVS